MKVRHDPDTGLVPWPKSKAKPLVGAALALAVVAGSVVASAPVDSAIKMLHDGGYRASYATK